MSAPAATVTVTSSLQAIANAVSASANTKPPWVMSWPFIMSSRSDHRDDRVARIVALDDHAERRGRPVALHHLSLAHGALSDAAGGCSDRS